MSPIPRWLRVYTVLAALACALSLSLLPGCSQPRGDSRSSSALDLLPTNPVPNPLQGQTTPLSPTATETLFPLPPAPPGGGVFYVTPYRKGTIGPEAFYTPTALPPGAPTRSVPQGQAPLWPTWDPRVPLPPTMPVPPVHWVTPVYATPTPLLMMTPVTLTPATALTSAPTSQATRAAGP